LVHGSSKELWNAGKAMAQALSQAKVVKAFNILWENYIVDPTMMGDGQHTIFVSGDDNGAKQVVANIICRMGFLSVDTGGIARSRNLEIMLDLWIKMFDGKTLFGFNFASPTPANNNICCEDTLST